MPPPQPLPRLRGISRQPARNERCWSLNALAGAAEGGGGGGQNEKPGFLDKLTPAEILREYIG